MPLEQTPFYVDWNFWTGVLALIAIILSQAPPVKLWFRPRRLEVEVHSRIQITHKVGNPNVGLFVSIRNSGGRALRITSITVDLERDGNVLGSYGAIQYFERINDQNATVFVPFTLRPGDNWEHFTKFFKEFDRATEKVYRESERALNKDIGTKLKEPHGDDPVAASDHFVAPLMRLYEALFIWEPGEYVATLRVHAQPGAASFEQRYRFTMFESDTAELKADVDDYKYGFGVCFNSQKPPLFIVLQARKP